MSILFVIGLVVSHVAAFVAGALVYRNNAKKAEGLLVDAQDQYDELKKKYDELRNKVG